VSKTSLDGVDAALARSGPAGVFEVTVDGCGIVGLCVSQSAASCL
jgi:threonine dehydrogenase-like Zn-dependent dehydrogenase